MKLYNKNNDTLHYWLIHSSPGIQESNTTRSRFLFVKEEPKTGRLFLHSNMVFNAHLLTSHSDYTSGHFLTRGWKCTRDQVYQLLTVTATPNHSSKSWSVICKCGHLVILNILSYSFQYNICSENNVWPMWCSKVLKTG